MVGATGTNLRYQWGAAVSGATDCSFVVPTQTVGVKYYRCHITAELDGTVISTSVEKFKCVKVTVEAAPMKPMSFTDVKNSDWFYEDVQYVYDRGLMDGVGNNKFDPNGKCTRAMIVTILYRMEGKPAHSGSNPFTDVSGGQWYTDAVIWAAENKIVNGVGKGKFDPEGEITREQMATILYRYAEKQEIDVSRQGDLSGYPDGGKVSDWALKEMQWAVSEGLIGGSDGYLLPQGSATRAQVATIFMRFIENIVKKN